MSSACPRVPRGYLCVEDNKANQINFTKLHFVYWNAAPAFFREVFRNLWKHLKGSSWEDNRSFGKKILESPAGNEIIRHCNRIQKDFIRCGNTNQWDLSLLLDIIKNLLPLLEPNSILLFSKITPKKIEFLKSTRNKLAHAADDSLDDTTFKTLWDETVKVLTSLGMASELLYKQFKLDCEQNILTRVKEIEEIVKQLQQAGDELLEKNQFADAVAEYTQGINFENVPQQPLGMLYCKRSLANFQLGNLQCAKDDAKSCITLLPHLFQGYVRLGKAYEELKSFEKAALNLSIAIGLGDTSQETTEALGWCKMMEAKRSCRIHLDPDFLRDNCFTVQKDITIKFPHGTKEYFISLGVNHYFGIEGFPVDYERAAEYFSKAAEMNSAYGLFQLAKMTMEGQGVERDVKKGFELYMQAASQDPVQDYGNGLKELNEGVSSACHAVGLAYDIGFAVEPDMKKALQWYHKALLCGHSGAANNIGILMGKSFFLQTEYLKLAAHLGMTNAVENLAINYLEKKYLKEAQQFFHYGLHKGSISFKGREYEYVSDPSLEKDFDPMKFEKLLEEEVRRSRVVGHLLEKIENFKKIFELNIRARKVLNKYEPIRESLGRQGAIIMHRQAMRENHEHLKEKCGWRKCASQAHPSLFGAEQVDLRGLKRINFKEMENQKERKVYTGHFLDVTVIEDAIVGISSIQVLAEDRNGDLGWLLIYNYPQPGPCNKETHEEIGFGCRLTVFYPVLHRTICGLTEIRVDDSELIFRKKNLRNVDRCRFCGKNAETTIMCKACRRVKYCSKSCLRKDAEDLQHSIICLKVIN